MSENSFIDLKKELNLNGNISEVAKIYVNSIKNVSKVTNLLEKNNIDYFVTSVDADFLDVTLKISKIILLVMPIISIIILHFYIKIFIQEKNNTLALYKALGFTKSDIKKLLILSILEILLISFIISLILLLLTKYLFMFLLRNDIEYSILSIKISYIPVFIYMFLIIIYFIFISALCVRKIYKSSIGDIML